MRFLTIIFALIYIGVSMGMITISCLGYGEYIDNSTKNSMDVFVENAGCLSTLIHAIYQFFITLFSIKPDVVRFTHQQWSFQVDKQELVRFIQKELASSNARNAISKETIEACLPAEPAITQDFETFLVVVKAAVLGARVTTVMGNGIRTALGGIQRGVGNLFG